MIWLFIVMYLGFGIFSIPFLQWLYRNEEGFSFDGDEWGILILAWWFFVPVLLLGRVWLGLERKLCKMQTMYAFILGASLEFTAAATFFLCGWYRITYKVNLNETGNVAVNVLAVMALCLIQICLLMGFFTLCYVTGKSKSRRRA